MASVFDGKNISYDFEKLHDYINNSGSGVALAPTAAGILVSVLEALKIKIKENNLNPDESDLPNALYAARELQKYVNHQQSEIANTAAARVYVTSLRADFVEMQRYEKEMDADG
jgi:hypothetical protein